MPGRSSRTREPWISGLGGVAVALPFLMVRYPPMGDLAFHEAAVALLRHFGDRRFAPPGLYALNLGQPNQLFHLLAYALSFVVSTDWACKIVVAGTAAGLVVAASRLAAYLDVSRWSALIVAPLALGWMARWGLVANLLGLALLLASLPVADRAAATPTPRSAATVASLAGLLYLAHESSLALFVVATLLFAVRTPRRLPQLALALAPTVAGCSLALAYHLRSAALQAPSIRAVDAIPVSFAHRLVELPASLFSVGGPSLAMFAASSLATLLLARGSPRRETPWRFVTFGLVSLAGYLFLPEAVLGSTLIYQRFLPPAFAVLVIAVLPKDAGSPRLAPLLALLPCAMLALTRPLFVEADRSYRDLDAVLAHMEDGAATAQLDLTPRSPSAVAPVVGGAARALAVHGGRLLFSFTDAPTYPVTMPPERRWDEPVRRMAMTPFAFAPSYDLTRFRYVLVWVSSARVRAVLGEAFAPEARLVLGEGSWMLFESTLPLASITAPDEPLPSPPPVPLATRVKALLDRGRPPQGP